MKDIVIPMVIVICIFIGLIIFCVKAGLHLWHTNEHLYSVAVFTAALTILSYLIESLDKILLDKVSEKIMRRQHE